MVCFAAGRQNSVYCYFAYVKNIYCIKKDKMLFFHPKTVRTAPAYMCTNVPTHTRTLKNLFTVKWFQSWAHRATVTFGFECTVEGSGECTVERVEVVYCVAAHCAEGQSVSRPVQIHCHAARVGERLDW